MKFANHNLTHDVKFTANMGDIVPIACFEALPGDVINHEAAALIRTQPLVTPVMHRADVKIHTWFVPYRILWENFEDFITGGRDGLDASVPPTMQLPSVAVGSLADYLGIPPTVNPVTVSAFAFRAYTHIYNNFYRDQDLITPLTENLGSGNDTTTSALLQQACWEKDYFTSARPQPQKGSGVTVPLAGSAPVKGIGFEGSPGIVGPRTVKESGGTTEVMANVLPTNNGNAFMKVTTSSGSTAFPSIFADLTGVSGISINDLRLVVAIQRFKENMMRFGSRYNERLEAFFGVRNLDQRLQLPEYLGGGTQTLQFSEVLQTAEGVDPVATMKGHGIGAMRSNRYKIKIPEYGIILSLMIVRPKTQYQDGLHKMWFRSVKEDFYQPELENLGQQAVQNREIYAAHSAPTGTFGFQDRYDDYRRIESRIAGDMRTLLDSWHMARKFTSDVALNETFVKANPTTRIYAVEGEDNLLCYVNHKIYARRRLAKIAKPMLF